MSATPAFRRKWGKYLPHQRDNVDQVPLPFVNGLEETYEEVGAKRVAINGNGPALAKRMATGQGVSTLLHIHLDSKRTEGVAPFLILLLDAHGRGFLTWEFLNGRL